MTSSAKTVSEYLASLPADRRKEIQKVRKLVKAHLPKGYKEGMLYGMIGYFVPLSRYPAGYHAQPGTPLPYIGLASQKNNLALYLMGVYMGDTNRQFESRWKKSGKRLDMGKSCLRFKTYEGLAEDAVAYAVGAMSVDALIATYERERKTYAAKKASAAKKS